MSEQMTLDSELLNDIVDLAGKSMASEKKVSIVPIPGSVDKEYLIVRPDGTFTREVPENSHRTVKLGSVDQVLPFLEMATERWAASPSVYFSKTEITARLSDNDIRVNPDGLAVCALRLTRQMKQLLRFGDDSDSAFMSHAAFVRMLRIDFAECYERDELDVLLAALRRLTWANGEMVASETSRNRSSLGQEVLSEMKSESEIPETTTLRVRIYEDRALQATRSVRCLIETNPAMKKLALIPMAEDLERALDEEMYDLGLLLQGTLRVTPKNFGDGPTATATPKEPIPVFYVA